MSEGTEAVAGGPGGEARARLRPAHGGAWDVLERVAGVTCRVAGVDEAVILLRDDAQGGALVAVARYGRGARQSVWHAEEGAVRRALASGAPAAEGERGGRARAAAPLVVGGHTRGVLAVSASPPASGFDGEQLGLLAELAEVVSSMLAESDRSARAEARVDAAVALLSSAVDMRDDYTGRHSAHVGELARRVGRRIGMPDTEVELLDYAARLHDIGKLGVPDAILQKPGPLDEAEWAVMRRHPHWGAEMLSRVPGLGGLAALVRGHHERWDGSGYPDGLARDGIPLAARVISACDAFEAMVSRRPYRAPLSVDHALAELAAGAGSQFDPAVVAAVEAERC